MELYHGKLSYSIWLVKDCEGSNQFKRFRCSQLQFLRSASFGYPILNPYDEYNFSAITQTFTAFPKAFRF